MLEADAPGAFELLRREPADPAVAYMCSTEGAAAGAPPCTYLGPSKAATHGVERAYLDTLPSYLDHMG